MNEKKSQIRKEMLRLRNSLAEEEIKEKSSKIIAGLLELREFNLSNLIMCYVDFNNEVVTRNFLQQCFLLGKRVAVPLVVRTPDGRKEILAAEINDIGNSLKKGAYGIQEPIKGMFKRVKPAEIDFIVVPGIVFNEYGHRIGYGAGLYDSFLKKLRSDCIRAGIAFEFQICDNIPVEEHDEPVDIVVTEEQLIRGCSND